MLYFYFNLIYFITKESYRSTRSELLQIYRSNLHYQSNPQFHFLKFLLKRMLNMVINILIDEKINDS